MLEEAINSVLDYTYENWELLILDDGSDDELTNEILNDYDGTHP